MTLTLTTKDRAAFTRAARVLTSPLEYANGDEWRRAVNRQLKAIFAADTAAFLLPGVDGDVYFSEEHDPAEGAKYVHLSPPTPREGGTVWDLAVATRVSTIDTLYGRDIGRYYASAYYNEYAGANGARHALAAMLPLAPGKPHPLRMANVSLWRSADTGACGGPFGLRERHLLELLFPSLSAGVEALTLWYQHRTNLLNTVEMLGQAVMVFDVDGGVIHQTVALTAALAADPEAEVLRTAMRRAAAGIASGLRQTADVAGHVMTPPAIAIRTAHAYYRARATVYGVPAERNPLILVSLDPHSATLPSLDALRQRFALTTAESHVALLLARGHSNAAIANSLSVRASTARRHTEHVLLKLGVRTRAQVGPRLMEPWEAKRSGCSK